MREHVKLLIAAIAFLAGVALLVMRFVPAVSMSRLTTAAATALPSNTPEPPAAQALLEPTSTPMPLPPTETATPLPPTETATPLPSDTPTNVPEPSPEVQALPEPTSTPTPLPPKPTRTPLPSSTPTHAPTHTATAIPTRTPTRTATPTTTPTATSTPTVRPTDTPVPTFTPEPTYTPTETPEATFGGCLSDPNPASAPNYPVRIVTVDKINEIVKLKNFSPQVVSIEDWNMCSINGHEEHNDIFGELQPGETRDFPSTEGGPPIWDDTQRDDGALYDDTGRLVAYWINQ
jgi:hypothetical protein